MPFKVNKKDALRMFRHMDQMRLAIAHDAAVVAQLAAKEYVDLVKSGIGLVKQTPSFVKEPWKELDPDWVRIKTANKEKFWIETGGILNNIRVNVLVRTLLFVQVFGGIDKWDDGEAYSRALKNEYGDFMGGKGFARPLFGPAISQFANRHIGGGGILGGEKGKEIRLKFYFVRQTAAKRVYVFSGGSLSGRI